MRWITDSLPNRMHMAVEGSSGGTSLGLHMAADVISTGGRVLWVGLEMPNPSRFPQLFSHLSPVAASKFHALLIGGALEKAVETVTSATSTLPSVKLVVFDDWCESSGHIPKSELELIRHLSNVIDKSIRLLLISKGTVDASGKRKGRIFARAESFFSEAGFDILTLAKDDTGYYRHLLIGESLTNLKIEDSGFVTIA
tara:strand:- start:8 stop:601 length:594 start_codon:yes stop_codon:yes gene_type:complete